MEGKVVEEEKEEEHEMEKKVTQNERFLNLFYSSIECEWTESNLGKHKSLKRYKDNITQRS
jgi:hypothetical protein